MIPHHELGNEILTLSEYDMCVEEGVLASPSFKYLIRDWRLAIVLSNEARTRQCHFSLHLSQFCLITVVLCHFQMVEDVSSKG